MIGSIFLFVLSCWNLLSIPIYGYFFGIFFFSDFLTLMTYMLEFVASLLLMIGFIMFRREEARRVSQAGYVSIPSGKTQAQAAPTRFCPKCGRQIPRDAEFCGFCGWQAEGQETN
jgi:ABC-type multidrug transport system permease subunit